MPCFFAGVQGKKHGGDRRKTRYLRENCRYASEEDRTNRKAQAGLTLGVIVHFAFALCQFGGGWQNKALAIAGRSRCCGGKKAYRNPRFLMHSEARGIVSSPLSPLRFA